MKCLVCGKNFGENSRECPRCRFPVVEIAGNDYEAGIRSLQPTIDKYRKDIAGSVTVSATVYNYEISGTGIAESGTETISFGCPMQFPGQILWHDDMFDTLPTRDSFGVSLTIDICGERFSVTVDVPNIKTAEKIALGVKTDQSYNLTVIVTDGNGKLTQSSPVAVFG